MVKLKCNSILSKLSAIDKSWWPAPYPRPLYPRQKALSKTTYWKRGPPGLRSGLEATQNLSASQVYNI